MYSPCESDSMAMDTGPRPAAKGELETAVSAPVGLTQFKVALVQAAKALILLVPWLATNRKLPSGVMVTADGAVPTKEDAPGNMVRAPELSIEKPRTVLVN